MANISSETSRRLNYMFQDFLFPGCRRVYPLIGQEILFGRNTRGHIEIRDPNASRNHCVIFHSPEGWRIKDNMSVNGTYVDNCRLKPNETAILQNGCKICLGPPCNDILAFYYASEDHKFVSPLKESGDSVSSENLTELIQKACPRVIGSRRSNHVIVYPPQKRKFIGKENFSAQCPKKIRITESPESSSEKVFNVVISGIKQEFPPMIGHPGESSVSSSICPYCGMGKEHTSQCETELLDEYASVGKCHNLYLVATSIASPKEKTTCSIKKPPQLLLVQHCIHTEISDGAIAGISNKNKRDNAIAVENIEECRKNVYSKGASHKDLDNNFAYPSPKVKNHIKEHLNVMFPERELHVDSAKSFSSGNKAYPFVSVDNQESSELDSDESDSSILSLDDDLMSRIKKKEAASLNKKAVPHQFAVEENLSNVKVDSMSIQKKLSSVKEEMKKERTFCNVKSTVAKQLIPFIDTESNATSVSEISNQGTEPEGETSQSLLKESSLLIAADPYPFSQCLDSMKENKHTFGETSSSHISELQERIKSQENNIEALKQSLFSLQVQSVDMKHSNSELMKKLSETKVFLNKQLEEKRKLKEDFIRCQQTIKNNLTAEIKDKLEEELLCNICTELFIQPILLGCSHAFCEFCIQEWKKKKKQCPICRQKITSETRALVLESFIAKAIEVLSPESQERRKELIQHREEQKKVIPKRSKRGRLRRIIRGSVSEVGGLEVLEVTSEGLSNEELRSYVNLITETINNTDDDDSEDEPVRGRGHYPGYGRCYNCGRRGHWANACPNN